MSRRGVDEDSWDSEEGDWDPGDESPEDVENVGADDDTPTVPCPYCRRPLPEDVPRCPYCERYLSSEDSASPPRKPWWIIIGALLVFYIAYRWIAR
jgi:hypothetical protein